MRGHGCPRFDLNPPGRLSVRLKSGLAKLAAALTMHWVIRSEGFDVAGTWLVWGDGRTAQRDEDRNCQ